MLYKFYFVTMTCAMFVPMVASCALQAAGLDTHDLVRGIISRSEAVFSGQLAYQQKSGFPKKDQTVRSYTLTFSGTSWRLDARIPLSSIPVAEPKNATEKAAGEARKKREGDIEHMITSHRGRSTNYSRTPREDGTLRDAARIAAEIPINSSFPSPPVFAGTFWFDCTKKFVAANAGKATVKPSVETNGVQTTVLEWAVAAADIDKAFHSTDEMTATGGFLRIYVAPQLGNVLPRIEYVGKNGFITTAFDSSQFVECAEGIFLPKECKMQYFTLGGPSFFVSYDLTETKKINQPVPESEFVLQLPLGTQIGDARGKGTDFFVIKNESSIPTDLMDVVAIQGVPFWRDWRVALACGAGLGVALLAAYTYRRRQRMGRQQV